MPCDQFVNLLVECSRTSSRHARCFITSSITNPFFPSKSTFFVMAVPFARSTGASSSAACTATRFVGLEELVPSGQEGSQFRRGEEQAGYGDGVAQRESYGGGG